VIPLLEVLKRTEAWLKERGSASPRLDAQLLMGRVLGMDRVQLYLNFDKPLNDDELGRLRALVRRRGEREPMAYLLGEREFWSLRFAVGPGVLVPRPDTETLVRAALPHCAAGDAAGPVFVADVGCGSGCVGMAIASEVPEVRVFATDRSRAALDCARENAAALGLADRVALLMGDLLDPVPASRPIDVVVSNPPYIASEVLATLEPEVRDHEPREALDGGADGLDIYRRLIPAAAARARRAVLVEIGFDQADAVRALFEAAGLREVQVIRDLGGNDRVVAGVG